MRVADKTRISEWKCETLFPDTQVFRRDDRLIQHLRTQYMLYRSERRAFLCRTNPEVGFSPYGAGGARCSISFDTHIYTHTFYTNFLLGGVSRQAKSSLIGYRSSHRGTQHHIVALPVTTQRAKRGWVFLWLVVSLFSFIISPSGVYTKPVDVALLST